MDDPVKYARLNRKMLMDRAKDRAKIAREMTRVTSYSPREHGPGEKSYVSPEEAIRALGLMETHRKIATDLVYRMVEGMPAIQAAKEARDAGIERTAVREMIRRTHRIIDEHRNLGRPVLSPRNNGPVRKAFNPLDLVKADKPPSGFVPMPKSKKGGYRYPAYPAPAQRYWYPGQGETHAPHDEDHAAVHEEHKDALKQQLAEAEQKGVPSKEVHAKFMEVEAKAREEGLRLNGHPTGKHTPEHIDELARRLEQAIERRRDAAEKDHPPKGDGEGSIADLDDNLDDNLGLSPNEEIEVLKKEHFQLGETIEDLELNGIDTESLKRRHALTGDITPENLDLSRYLIRALQYSALGLIMGLMTGGGPGAVSGAAGAAQRLMSTPALLQYERERLRDMQRRMRQSRRTGMPTGQFTMKSGLYVDLKSGDVVIASDNLAKAESYKVPAGARGNARKVLEWKRKYGSEVKGMTSVGWARARQLATQATIGLDTVKRMSAFNRHRKNAAVDPKYKDTPWKDAGYVAWLGWGGTTGVDWARRITGALDKASAELSLAKAAGPYIGPKGGKWADPQHTIPWKEYNHDNVKVTDEVLGSHSGQKDALLTAKRGSRVIGRLHYSVFEGTPLIQKVEVAEKRAGVGSKLVDQLASKYGYANIDWGMMTESGHALQAALDRKYGFVREAATKKLDGHAFGQKYGEVLEHKHVSNKQQQVYVELNSREKMDALTAETGRLGGEIMSVQEHDGTFWTEVRLPSLAKAAGPYIGPRGGKWKDPQHKIPWRGPMRPRPHAHHHGALNSDDIRALEAYIAERMGDRPPPGKKVEIPLTFDETGTHIVVVKASTNPRRAQASRSADGKGGYVEIDVLAGKPLARERLRALLAHEIAHAADPDLIGKNVDTSALHDAEHATHWAERKPLRAEAAICLEEPAVIAHGLYLMEHGTPWGKKPLSKPEAATQMLDMIPPKRSVAQAGLLPEMHAYAMKLLGSKLSKAAGPYIGPKGGKWADPQHTIPYKEPKGQKRAKPAKAKPKGSTTPKAKPGSQLPKEMYERLVELQCSRFPPADIPLSEIKVGDLHGSDIHERALLKYRTPKGKIQSGYTATFIARKAAEKFALVAKHKPVYAKIKRDVVSDLRKHEVGSGEHQAATVIAIIAHTGLRPGSAQSVRDHKRYGVTELRPEHVKIDGDTASFDYIGKSGEHNTATIRNKDIVAALKPYVDKAKRGQPIFERGTLGRANNQSIKGRELNLKDYRTIVGTIAAEKYLAKVKKPPPEVMGDNKRLNKYLAKTLNDASAHVADVLNNKPATARTSYIHPKVFEDWAIKELGVSPSLWEEVK